MRILIDMNLSPDWVTRFASHQIESVHWSAIGRPNATDTEIMGFARDNDYVVFTHDLDFGAILSATQARGPSVIQIRTQDVLSIKLTAIVFSVLTDHKASISSGALVTIDETRARVRILPLK